MTATHFGLEWLMPVEPGLSTHVALLAHDDEHEEAPLATGSGGDESEALVDLWTTLVSRHDLPDAIPYVAAACWRRAGKAPDQLLA